jgi:hypothetical protein
MGSVTYSTFPESTVQANTPNWVRYYQNNAGVGTPNRNYWTLGAAGKNLIMVSVTKSCHSVALFESKPLTWAVTCSLTLMSLWFGI